MPFRADLDLDAVLHKARWKNPQAYVDNPSTAGKIDYIDPDSTYRDPMEHQDPIPSGLYHENQRTEVNEPLKMGRGSPLASSSVSLATRPIVCWDVNGYYSALGVHWKASRKELRDAYLASNGQRSVYLTYVLKQLLNDVIRREYDCVPLGEPYLNDEYVQEAIKRKAAEEAKKRSKSGAFTTARQVVEETWRYIPEEGGPSDDQSGSPRPPELSEGPDSVTPWPWPYYIWRTFSADTDKLAAWQRVLVSTMAARGITSRFAVGLLGRQPHPYLIGWTSGPDEHLVIYINVREDVTDDLARRAIDALMPTR